MPRNILHCSENPLSCCLAVQFRMEASAINSSHLLRIRSPQLFKCLTKFYGMLFDLPKITYSLLLLKFLPACIMVNSILLVVFVGTPWPCHFEPNDAMCANARCHQVILLNYLSDSDVLPDMSWFSTIQFLLIVLLSLSTYLSLIRASASDHSFGNHNSVVF
jgi:hypothetical protein